MPLRSGSSRATVSSNIEELYKANARRPKPRPRKQIIAIALSSARRGRKRKPTAQ